MKFAAQISSFYKRHNNNTSRGPRQDYGKAV